jgi:hypothetical protein
MSASGLRTALGELRTKGVNARSGVAFGDIADRADNYRRGLGLAAGAIEPALWERETRGKLKLAALGRGIADTSAGLNLEHARNVSSTAMDRAQIRIGERAQMLDAAFGAAGLWAGSKPEVALWTRNNPPVR